MSRIQKIAIMCAKVHSYAALRVTCRDSLDCMHTKASEVQCCGILSIPALMRRSWSAIC